MGISVLRSWRWIVAIAIAVVYGYAVIVLLPPFYAAVLVAPCWMTIGAAFAERRIRTGGRGLQ